MTPLRFPDSFLFGASTSAYQIEGAAAEDGRGPSIWDTFCQGGARRRRRQGRRHGRPLPPLARGRCADGRDRAPEYRFSIAWPRVLPGGRSPVNPRGLGFYDALVDGLLAAGIAPASRSTTGTCRRRFDDEGGWLARSTAEAFAAYARSASTRWATCRDLD